jgi:hypothetical protein
VGRGEISNRLHLVRAARGLKTKSPARGNCEGAEKTPAQRAGVEGREKQQRERYFFFFLPAFLAFFFLAMPQCRKFSAQLHELIYVS